MEAVQRLCGLQAQEPRPPFVGLWTRLAGFDPDLLTGALRERTIVRATLMRATLHLMSARDYLALRPALAPVLEGGLRQRVARTEGLEPEAVLKVGRELLSRRPRTFEELRVELAQAFPAVDERLLGAVVRLGLALVMVPTEDRWGFPRVCQFALAERWLDGQATGDASPRQLVLRYLAAFGPASAADVQTWSGLRGISKVLAELREELCVFHGPHGRELFDLPDAPRPPADTPAPPRFLPEFDNLVLAHADRTRLMPAEHRARMTTRNLRVPATFLCDGMVCGIWRVERRSGTATLHLMPFAAPTRAAKAALGEEAEALLSFVEPEARTTALRWHEP